MEVTIILPVYNRATLVNRTLGSIAAQTHRPLHVVLVDNNSTDDTIVSLQDFKRECECEDFRVTVLSEPRQGAAIARNTGFRAADTEWVMFFDSDDTMDARLVESYVKKIEEAHGEVDMIATRSDVTNLFGHKRQQPYFEHGLIKYHIFDACLNTARYIVRREFFEAAGCWNETLTGWDDWELGVKLLLKHPRIAFMGGVVMVHVFLTDVSITGTNFYGSRGAWERALDAIEALLRASDEPQKERYLKYVEYRRVLLAGKYANEGHREASRELWEATYARVRHDGTMRWLYPLLYKYISAGGIAAGRIVKLLV